MRRGGLNELREGGKDWKSQPCCLEFSLTTCVTLLAVPEGRPALGALAVGGEALASGGFSRYTAAKHSIE